MKKNTLIRALLFATTFGLLTLPFVFKTANAANAQDAWISQQMKVIKAQTNNISDNVLRLSLVAYTKIRQQGMDNKELLTVIDYSLPSNAKRLWVFDLKTDKLLYNTWVSHGKNSGNLNATSFSNSVGSLKSSIGVFVTDTNTYIGKRGLAVRLKGLEHGINDNAYRRAVVVHGAPYVNADIIKKTGRVGRSWGCPAVTTTLAKPIINTIKDNTLVFAYYPDQNWLKHSQYLA